ncbi:hypothetical protein ACFRLW_47010, partial [Streptomyces sp. NPDC056728]
LRHFEDQPVAVHLCGHQPEAGANPRIRSNPYTTSLDATPALQLLVRETAASRPGSALMTVHLVRIIFVQALRTLSATGESWFWIIFSVESVVIENVVPKGELVAVRARAAAARLRVRRAGQCRPGCTAGTYVGSPTVRSAGSPSGMDVEVPVCRRCLNVLR